MHIEASCFANLLFETDCIDSLCSNSAKTYYKTKVPISISALFNGSIMYRYKPEEAYGGGGLVGGVARQNVKINRGGKRKIKERNGENGEKDGKFGLGNRLAPD